MRIGMISQWYHPEPGAAAHPTAIADALARRGHQVRVLTGFPSYPEGKVYPGYRMSLRKTERIRDVVVRRIPDSPSHDNSAVRRAASLTSFALSASTQVSWLRGADACLVYLTPATVGFAARVLRLTSGVPYVLYVQDLWPESVTESGFVSNGRLLRLAERGIHSFLSGLYENASGIAAISPGMARLLDQRGADGAQVIYNWVDEGVFGQQADSLASEEMLTDGRRYLMYAGGVGDLQGLDASIRALARLRDRVPELGLAVVGDGVAVPSLRTLTNELDLQDRVKFLGPRPMSQMAALMNQAEAQIVSLKDLPLFRVTVPSKLQSAMAAGQPVVCAVAGDAADLVLDSRCGLVAAAGSVESTADAFLRMSQLSSAERQEMGSRGRSYYHRELSADVGAARLEALLERARLAR